MLSLLPGAMNLPNKPMMIPAMMTPMISTSSSSNVTDVPCAASAVHRQRSRSVHN
jgi:hypothetical protein